MNTEEIIKTIEDVDNDKKSASGKVTTDKGTDIYWEVYYDKGGYNQFTSTAEPRAIEASLQRQSGEVAAFSNLNDPAGAERIVLIKVGRFSKKQLKLGIEKLAQILPDYLAENYPNL